jgi:hypothetical protein
MKNNLFLLKITTFILLSMPLLAAALSTTTEQPSLKGSLTTIVNVQDTLYNLAKKDSSQGSIAALILLYAYPFCWDENNQATPLLLALATNDMNAFEEAFYTLRTTKNFLLGVLSKDHPLYETAKLVAEMMKNLTTDEQKTIQFLVEEICLFCQLAETELYSRYGAPQKELDGSAAKDCEIKNAQFALEQTRKQLQKYATSRKALDAKITQLAEELQKQLPPRTLFSRRSKLTPGSKAAHLKNALSTHKAVRKMLQTSAVQAFESSALS